MNLKRTIRAPLLLAIFVACLAGVSVAQPPDFAPRFADKMVIQRGAPIVIEGTAAPGAEVSVSLGTTSSTVTASADGSWFATLPAQEAARWLTLAAATTEGVALRSDILAGDVFLCSGQSNMEHPVARALNPDTELAGPFSPDLRLLKIPQKSSVTPQAALPEGTRWQPATAQTVSSFSAICYFFGRDLVAQTGVPVGLIDSSWGGSRIEPWISAAGLQGIPQLTEGLAQAALYATDPAAAQAMYGKAWEAWWASVSPGYTPWKTGLAAAKPVPGILRDWKAFGDPSLENHLGLVWFERSVEIAGATDPGAALISLGGMDEIDSVWVNGKFVGTSFGWGTPRTYFLPAGILKPGTNRITVSVYNGWGAGGMTGPEDALKLSLTSGDVISLAGRWSYEKVSPAFGSPPSPPWQSISGLSGLHNAMIAPLAGSRLAGALWYQGESNTGEPAAYKELLERLAADLRRQFGDALPIMVFQLPEYGERAYQAGPSNWSALRDAQRRFVVDDPASGLTVVLGAGDPWDIHPPNKHEAARRALALWNKIIAGNPGPARTGYSPVGLKRNGSSLNITLPDAPGPYRLAGSDNPVGFSLCDTKQTCRFSEAKLTGRSIEIRNVPRNTVKVRYCWGDTPICNMMSPENTPVTPFELEVP